MTGQNEKIRLNRFLAQSGLGSRRSCDSLIESGHILVNGQKITALGTKVDPALDRVEYKGKHIYPVRKNEYFAFYKPRETVVTASDPENRTTIYDFLKSNGLDAAHLKYAGRLDYHSEGLLLLTNDGDLVHALTHPRFNIKKVYRVRLDKPIQKADYTRLIEGIESEGQVLHAAAVRSLDNYKEGQYWYELDLFEGKNRQIRRMVEALGYSVKRLVRVQFGTLRLGEMKSGEFRALTEKEVGGLQNFGYKIDHPPKEHK